MKILFFWKSSNKCLKNWKNKLKNLKKCQKFENIWKFRKNIFSKFPKFLKEIDTESLFNASTCFSVNGRASALPLSPVCSLSPVKSIRGDRFVHIFDIRMDLYHLRLTVVPFHHKMCGRSTNRLWWLWQGHLIVNKT